MSEAVSALKGAFWDGYVSVGEIGLMGMITLRGDLGSAAMRSAVASATGADMPDRRGITASGENRVAWMAPDELMLMVPHGGVEAALAALHEALAGEYHLAVNVSDARAVFRIEGEGVREVVAKLCPVDMAPGAFEPGTIRRTRMAQVPAALWMTDPQTVQIVCFRSVAAYVFDLLKGAASPGSEVGYPV